jgi:hypothetical protein
VDNECTPPYVRYLARLMRPFPNFDFFFIKQLRQSAVNALQLQQGSRVLDVWVADPEALSRIWSKRLGRTVKWLV